MTLLAPVLAAAWLVHLQEPAPELLRDLADQSPATRRAAAERLAAQDSGMEEWILREAHRGDLQRQRALALAAALLGTEPGLEFLEGVTRKGTRPDPQRAYALFLFGAFHAGAAEHPDQALRRAASDFERCCFLAGLLAQAQDVDLALLRKDLRGAPEPCRAGLQRMFAVLQRRAPQDEPRSDPELAAALLGSVLPNNPSLPGEWIQAAEGRVPPLWVMAASRHPARSLESLRREPAGGAGSGLALVLYELEMGDREEAFAVLRERFVEPEARCWLWGAAGDAGLELAVPSGSALADEHVAGLARLALLDAGRAAATAAAWRPMARRRFQAGSSVKETWPAALVLALAPEEEDRQALQARLESDEVTPEERARLHPIWQLATGRLAPEGARQAWLKRWSRELRAGYLGMLDVECRRFVAYLLVSGTIAGRYRREVSAPAPGLVGPRDHSRDDELYLDVAELVLSDLYRLDLP